eukprot:2626588-Amphidinium_carterae.2
MGRPAQVQHLDVSSTVAKLRTFMKKVPRGLQSRDVVALVESLAIEPSGLQSWRQQGCLSSLIGVYEQARRLGLVQFNEPELDVQLLHQWPTIQKTFSNIYVPTEDTARRLKRHRPYLYLRLSVWPASTRPKSSLISV